MRILTSFLFSFLAIFSLTSSEQKVVLISGASGGIGKACVQAFEKQGWKVWAGTRYPEKIQETANIKALYLDVTDSASIQNAVRNLCKEEGRMDLLINNAGYGIIGAEEIVALQEARDLFEVNFFGALNLIQESLVIMREQHFGHIINISSTSGVRAIAGLGLYAASKFALEALSESLAVSLSPWNISVSLVEPGSVKNRWGEHCKLAAFPSQEPIYDKLLVALKEKIALLAQTGQPCEEIAALIVKIACEEHPQLRYQTSDKVKETVCKKLVDPTGEALKNEQLFFFRSLLLPSSIDGG